jgi:GT2 family glycosyltransferase
MEHSKPVISIIIVNHNGVRFLPRLLQSIYEQTFNKYEVIVVDNESKDDSIEYLKRNHRGVKIVSYENKGFGSACNIGARQSNGEYLTFFNEDMYIPIDFLEKMYNEFYEVEKNDPRIAGMSCKMVDFDANPDLVPNKYGGQIDLFGYPINKWDEKDIFTISGSPFFCNKKTFYKLGGFSEFIFLYGEDTELCWRSRILGYTLYMNHKTHVFHYGGGVTGGFTPAKISLILIAPVISVINCYSFVVLLIVFLMYLPFVLTLLIFLTIYYRYDLSILKNYLANLKKILSSSHEVLKFRKMVQRNRVLKDREILKYVSLTPGLIYSKSWKKLSPSYKIKN